MVKDIINKLHSAPQTLPGLAHSLGASLGVTEEALMLLEAKGYVALAYEGSQACPGCGSCSMKRMCPSSGQEKPATPVWRLTIKGSQRSSATP